MLRKLAGLCYMKLLFDPGTRYMPQHPRPCLVVFFNHRYESNVAKLEQLYGTRFTEHLYLMPFYEDFSRRVIRVYGSCFYFHSFFHQALPFFYHESFTHYVFAADDLILNPKINQDNILSLLGVGERGGYIKGYWRLHDINFPWAHLPEVLSTFRKPLAEVDKELPPFDTAMDLLKRHNIDLGSFTMTMATKQLLLDGIKDPAKKVNFLLEHYQRGEEKFPYPAVGAYSDLVIVPAHAIKLFCHYCGIFDAMGLFVEVAVPTALMFACDEVAFEPRTFRGVEFWDLAGYEELHKLHAGCGGRISELFKSYPDASYIHPLKLSWWDV